ncbi:MAG: hypothetical protein ABEK36_05785 [Candidatus Aenigmatarchaeota archaeon]
MPKIEIENVEAMLEKEVSEQGRVSGLKQWVGQKAIIVIPKE